MTISLRLPDDAERRLEEAARRLAVVRPVSGYAVGAVVVRVVIGTLINRQCA